MLFWLFGGITRTHRAPNANCVFTNLSPNTPQGRGTSLSHTGRNAHMGGSNFIFSKGQFFYPLWLQPHQSLSTLQRLKRAHSEKEYK